MNANREEREKKSAGLSVPFKKKSACLSFPLEKRMQADLFPVEKDAGQPGPHLYDVKMDN